MVCPHVECDATITLAFLFFFPLSYLRRLMYPFISPISILNVVLKLNRGYNRVFNCSIMVRNEVAGEIRLSWTNGAGNIYFRV